MNCINKIEIKDGDVYMSCKRFGISSEDFKNKVLSNTYKNGGQPALDKSIISMLLDKLCPVELGGDDPSILPYKKALEAAEQQHVLSFYRDKINQQHKQYLARRMEFDQLTQSNVWLKEYLNRRDELIQEMLNAIAAFIVR